jgi:thiamine pyrophosphokinase
LRAVIFANGDIQDLQAAREAIQDGDLLVAADGGTRNCLTLGLTPDHVIGDMDSIDPGQRNALEAGYTRFHAFPTDKDLTDLELAISFASAQGAEEILLLGLLGGRLDQTLANLLLLARPEWRNIRLMVIEGPDTAHILHDLGRLTIEGEVGDIVSLITLSPQVTGITTQCLRWPLEDAALRFGSTLGVSNQMTASEAEIRLREGTLLVVHRTDETR